MIDLVKEFAKYDKQITQYIIERVRNTYFSSQCFKSLTNRVNKMNDCWDLKSGSTANRFIVDTYYPLVKQQIKMRRAIFSNSFRLDPFFMVSPAGAATTFEAAQNMQDIISANNKNIRFNEVVKWPALNMLSRYGTVVCYVEFSIDGKSVYKTRVNKNFGMVARERENRNKKVAKVTVLDPRHYFQNPLIIDHEYSDYKGHIERLPLAAIIAEYKSNPDMFIKQNIEKVIEEGKKSPLCINEYIDPQGKVSFSDYDKLLMCDVIKGQFVIKIPGNEDDYNYYNAWLINDKIVKFQDNPYDEDMCQYSVITMEPRFDTFHGNTTAEDSVGNENALNLINSVGLENLIASMRRLNVFNKNALPENFGMGGLNQFYGVDVAPNVNLANLVYSSQIQDTSGNFNELMAARINQNEQRLSATSDAVNPSNTAGSNNQTATWVQTANNQGAMLNSDIVEWVGLGFANIGRKQGIIIQQYFGVGDNGQMNGVELTARPQQESRVINKQDFEGEFEYKTNAFKSQIGEIMEDQNMVSWLQNLIGANQSLQNVNIQKMVHDIIRKSQKWNVDDIIPQQIQNVPGYQQSIQPQQQGGGSVNEIPQEMMAQPQPGMMQ